ncbi:hypothetical protein [Parvibium lacunae]|uniref:Uncharacterized protein n=1 Tax=Parvibium lacunae TaxID=1888893 RepID=A0A368L905_9BURK|nr:hypothetical protein [Parvibium lacunae]RCS59719.1 hypothetical protein DU000_03150 [Parvibium lacunae]
MYNFGVGSVILKRTKDAAGNTIAIPQAEQLLALQEIELGIDIELKQLKGSGVFPLAVAQAGGKIEVKAKVGDINTSAFETLWGEAAQATSTLVQQGEACSVPANSPYTITVAPPLSGTFQEDLGLIDVATGQPLRRVTATPAAGEYSVSAGVYTLHSSAAGKALLRSYEYTTTSAGAKTYNINNRLMGASPRFSIVMCNRFDGKTVAVKLHSCVSSKFMLPFKSDDFAQQPFEAQAFDNGAGSVGYLSFW